MNKEEVVEELESKEYKFAKTMPWCPHEYTLRKNWDNSELFEDIVQFIRDNGVREFFGKRLMIYFYANGWKYWTMGSPLNKTPLINRAKADKKPNETQNKIRS